MRDGFIRTDSTSATATRKAIYRTVPDNAGQSLSAAKPLTFQREYLNNGKLMVHASSWTVEATGDHHGSGGHLRLLGDRVAHALPALAIGPALSAGGTAPTPRIMCAWNSNMDRRPTARGS